MVIDHSNGGKLVECRRSLSRVATFLCSAALAMALQPSSGAAQQEVAKSPGSADVVVVARGKQDVERQIHDFVRAMTITENDDMVARFDIEKLCPRVIGLEPQYDAMIVKRMRQVANASRIDVATDNCLSYNALVIFTDDMAATVKLVQHRYSSLIENHLGEPIRIRKEPGHATAWHLTRLVPTNTTDGASRIMSNVHPTYVMSVVIIERHGAYGLTVTQIADYAIMRTLADISPARVASTNAPTILSVLDAPFGSETPLSLTQWDLDFLLGLHNIPTAFYSGAQRGSIDRSMKRALTEPGQARK